MRYYYTDPLAAAWMAKQFGMKFTDAAGEPVSIQESYFRGTKSGAAWEAWINDESSTPYVALSQAYIHPDSLHLLEPQVGDVVAVKNVVGKGMSVGVVEDGCKTMTLDGEEGAGWNYSGDDPIIQRNGTAFHWPEVEK